jgi:hypothetical protein
MLQHAKPVRMHQVDYQLDFAEWLASCTDLSAQSTPDSMPTPEGLLQDALDALEVPCGPIGCVSVSATGSRTRSASGGVQTTGQTPGIDIYNEAPAAPAAPEAAAAAAAGPRWSRATAEGLVSGGVDQAGAGRKLEQLLRVHLLLSQVRPASPIVCMLPCVQVRIVAQLSRHVGCLGVHVELRWIHSAQCTLFPATCAALALQTYAAVAIPHAGGSTV